METNSTNLQRLDFVAKSLCNNSGVGIFRSVMTGTAVFIFSLAFISEAPPRETNLVRALAAVALISALVAWLKPRFASYGWAAVFLMMAVAALMSDDYSRTVSGWTSKILSAALMLLLVFQFSQEAWRATVIQSDRWTAERETVQKWLAKLAGSDLSPEILQFDSESFRAGYFTYRLLNTGYCWVVGKSKKGNVQRVIECRVYPLNEVRQIETGQGQIEISIYDRRIPAVKTTPEMRARLSSCLAMK